MTVKHTDITVKGKIKKHPNEKLYPGRPCFETGNAFMQALECLTEDEFNQMLNKTLIYDEESTAELFDEIKPGDIIGVCGHEEGIGWVAKQWEVLSIDPESDTMECLTRYKPAEQRTLYFEDISIGMVLGLAEILLRDDKPYGIETEVEYKVRFLHDEHVDTGESEESDVDDEEKETAKQIDNMISEGGPVHV